MMVARGIIYGKVAKEEKTRIRNIGRREEKPGEEKKRRGRNEET